MNYILIPVHQLDSQQLKLLASLHQAVMETLLSDLGFPIVERYYQAAAEDEKVIGFCAVREGAALGWVVGSPHPQALNNRLRSPLWWFALQMLRVLFTRPRLLWQLAVSARLARNESIPEPGEIELTYLGVAPEARGQKLGYALLQEFITTCRAAGYKKVLLSVEIENEAAADLYRKSDFQIAKTFTEGQYERHRMELTLESTL